MLILSFSLDTNKLNPILFLFVGGCVNLLRLSCAVFACHHHVNRPARRASLPLMPISVSSPEVKTLSPNQDNKSYLQSSPCTPNMTAGRAIIFGVCLVYEPVAPVSRTQRGAVPPVSRIKSIMPIRRLNSITLPGPYSAAWLLYLWLYCAGNAVVKRCRARWELDYYLLMEAVCLDESACICCSGLLADGCPH